ncbi:MAG: glycosyltransferase, partial [Solirubrobacteraceae bacterium]
MREVPLAPISLERFRALLGAGYSEVEQAIDRARGALAGRVIWHVNSAPRGGGVAEMLQSLLAYARGAGVDVRWVTIGGNEDFFRITKRIHNQLHGADGDGGELGDAERAVYEAALAASAEELIPQLGSRDIVYLHDPQTAGLTHALRSATGRIVWRCHGGLDSPNEWARRAWEFLLPYVEEADAYVFSRRAFAWGGLDDRKLWVVAPSIDVFSPKNQEMGPGTVRAILARTGLAEAGGTAPVFLRQDGSQGRVHRAAELDQEGPVPDDLPLVAQISRWDRLKDPAGVLRVFVERCRHPGAHLLLAGPSVAEVADDPEDAEVLAEIRAQREGLSAQLRARIHLACLPMDDVDENAAIVNAVQRRADVVIQKSLAEGFGLTVAEAMWKARPVIASRIGGIQDQIVNGESGVLIDDPLDLDATAAAVDRLLDDSALASAMGTAARARVRGSFLGTRHLIQYVGLLEEMLSSK